MSIPGGFHFFKGNENICRPFPDDRGVDFRTKPYLSTDTATALAHAVDFAHFDIVSIFYETLGKNLAGQDRTLPADADEEYAFTSFMIIPLSLR